MAATSNLVCFASSGRPTSVHCVTRSARFAAEVAAVHAGALASTRRRDPVSQACDVASTGRTDLVHAYWMQYKLSTSERRADRLASEQYFWAREAANEVAGDGSDGVVELLVELADPAD